MQISLAASPVLFHLHFFSQRGGRKSTGLAARLICRYVCSTIHECKTVHIAARMPTVKQVLYSDRFSHHIHCMFDSCMYIQYSEFLLIRQTLLSVINFVHELIEKAAH